MPLTKKVVKSPEPEVLEEDSIVKQPELTEESEDEKQDQSTIPEFDRKGYGFLNPFRKYNKKSDEEVDIRLIK